MKGTIVRLMHLRPLALSAVAVLCWAPAALALDADDFAAKITKVWSSSAGGVSIKLGPGTVNGNDVSFAGISISAPAAGAEPINAATKLDFTGVTEQADGSYLADALKLPDIDYKPDDKTNLSVKNIAFHHIFVPGGQAPSVVDSSRVFGEASVGPIVLTVGGTPTLKLDSVEVSNGFKPSQSDANLAEIDSNGSTGGLIFDASTVLDPEGLDEYKELGLVTTTAKLLEAVTWSLGDGHLDLSELSLDIDKVGKVKFALDMTGYTPQFLQNLSTAAQAMGQTDVNGTSNTQAATAMLLASVQTLFLNSASLRFDDAAITNKLLDASAKQAGVDRATLIGQLVAQVPGDLNEDGSSTVPVDTVKVIQAALRAYLTDPHSIEIRLAPKSPLGVLGIVAAAMAPTNVADQVGLKILVNDKEVTTADAAKETGIAPTSTDDSFSSSDDSSSGDDSSATTPDDSSTAAPSDDGSQAPAADDSSGSDASGSRLTNTHNH